MRSNMRLGVFWGWLYFSCVPHTCFNVIEDVIDYLEVEYEGPSFAITSFDVTHRKGSSLFCEIEAHEGSTKNACEETHLSI